MTSIPDDEYRWALRNDFTTFVERAFLELHPGTEYLYNPHIGIIAAALDECRLGKRKRLIINLPPRSLKSHLASVALPAFILGHRPSAKIICASYAQSLADNFARATRTLIQTAWYRHLFPHTRLSPEKHSTDDFFTTVGGYRMATSVGGPLTGRGADFIILDDMLKPDDAFSETRRSGVNDWYDNSLLSRLNSKKDGVIINVMQRLHGDDLVGHILEKGPCDVLSFAAIAEKDETYEAQTPLGATTFQRRKGEALHPEREPLAVLEGLHESMGTYTFLSQYQQAPVPPGGAIFKTNWLRYYDQLPERFQSVIESWDTANKASELSCYSVCTTWGMYNKHYYLLDVHRCKYEFPQLVRAAIKLSEYPSLRAIVIEDKASGTQLLQELRSKGVYRLKPYLPQPDSDKRVRAHAQTICFENGQVLLPRAAPWLQEYIEELTSFPGSKYSDQVDSTTQALEYLKTHCTGRFAKIAEMKDLSPDDDPFSHSYVTLSPNYNTITMRQYDDNEKA